MFANLCSISVLRPDFPFMHSRHPERSEGSLYSPSAATLYIVRQLQPHTYSSRVKNRMAVPDLIRAAILSSTINLIASNMPSGTQSAYSLAAIASRSVAAAASGVMSRWGEPSSSKPTINFRTVADRSSGG